VHSSYQELASKRCVNKSVEIFVFIHKIKQFCCATKTNEQFVHIYALGTMYKNYILILEIFFWGGEGSDISKSRKIVDAISSRTAGLCNGVLKCIQLPYY
jgi:hypothetical protein